MARYDEDEDLIDDDIIDDEEDSRLWDTDEDMDDDLDDGLGDADLIDDESLDA